LTTTSVFFSLLSWWRKNIKKSVDNNINRCYIFNRMYSGHSIGHIIIKSAQTCNKKDYWCTAITPIVLFLCSDYRYNSVLGINTCARLLSGNI
jgi:hypothetical protein